jgi:hypothetical protein
MLSFLSRKNLPGNLVGMYMVTAIYSITTVVQQWAMSNVAGHTKRSVTAALMAACYGVGQIIAPMTFTHDSAPRYLPAKITILISQSVCACILVSLFLYYKFENARRDRKEKADVLEDDNGMAHVTTTEAWAGLTDQQNKRFRYVY